MFSSLIYRKKRHFSGDKKTFRRFVGNACTFLFFMLMLQLRLFLLSVLRIFVQCCIPLPLPGYSLMG